MMCLGCSEVEECVRARRASVPESSNDLQYQVHQSYAWDEDVWPYDCVREFVATVSSTLSRATTPTRRKSVSL